MSLPQRPSDWGNLHSKPSYWSCISWRLLKCSTRNRRWDACRSRWTARLPTTSPSPWNPYCTVHVMPLLPQVYFMVIHGKVIHKDNRCKNLFIQATNCWSLSAEDNLLALKPSWKNLHAAIDSEPLYHHLRLSRKKAVGQQFSTQFKTSLLLEIELNCAYNYGRFYHPHPTYWCSMLGWTERAKTVVITVGTNCK